MFRRKSSLLDEIEDDLLAERPIAPTLRKCMLLGSRTGSTQLRDWAARELKGYEGVETDHMPKYRVATAPLYLDGFVSGHRIVREPVSPMAIEKYNSGVFDETVVFRQGISEIESLSASDEPTLLAPPGAADLAMIINVDPDQDQGRRVERIYWMISPITLRGVIDGVRTALTELVSEMGAGLQVGQELPNKDLADQAFNIAIRGVGHRITISNAQASGGDATASIGNDPAPSGGFWTPARQLGAFAAGLASFAGLALAVWQQGWI